MNAACPEPRRPFGQVRAGCNIFVTTANAGQAERLLGALQRLEVDGMWWGPATYYPTPRGRRNERLRPQPLDLRLVAAWVRELSLFDHDVWANLEAHTEAAWVARALAGDWPTWTRHDGQVLELVCCPNLDLHTGGAGWYRERHGNLRADGGQAVLGRALAQGGRSTIMHCGLIPIRCRRLPSWPRGMAAVTAGGGRGQQPAWGGIGHVSKQAVRLRVLFHQGRPLELIPVEAGDGFPVNFYAGFYLEAGPGPAEDQLPMPAVDRVVALGQAGRQSAHCRLAVGPANTC